MSRRVIPGFQQSRNTGVYVRVYPHGDDPVLRNAREVLEFGGGYNTQAADFAVTAVTVTKNMGQAAGTWSITVKAPEAFGSRKPSFLERVVDDDWVDLAFVLHGRIHHVMRGQVDTVREVRSTGGAGEPSRTYTLTGRDFGAIFEKTWIWFNIHREALARTYAIKLFGSRGVSGPPDTTVRTLLYGFLETLTGLGRADWALPPSMPGVKGTFAEQVVFDASEFEPSPDRVAASVQLLNPEGQTLWKFVQDWSDPSFCELFCDLVPRNPGPSAAPDRALGLDDTQMAVVFRTRPHPSQRLGSTAWRALETVEVPPQHVVSRDIGRGGTERYNAYLVAPQVVKALNRTDLVAPLWDLDSIRRHGMRPFYVESRYVAAENNLVTMTSQQRELLRDWHCMNPYLFNGSVNLGALYPQIRVGTRLRILGEEEAQQETYYVEQVSHSWTAGASGRTSVGVTRGWVGTDASYEAQMREVAAGYRSAMDGPGDAVGYATGVA